MRHLPRRPLLTALLCALALLGAGCHKNGAPQASGPAGVPATVQPPQNVQGSAAAPGNELNPAPQAVAPPANKATPDLTPDELAAQKRDLEQRQAVLDERERQLDAREEKQAAAAPQPIPERAAPVPSAPEPVEARSVRPSPVRPAPPAVVTVPSGTRLPVALEQGLSSRTSRAGERFRARVTAPVRVRGAVAIPAGSELIGEVTRAGGTRRIGGQQVLAVRFTGLALPHGPTVPIRASFSEVGRNKARRDTAIIGGSAVGGAVIGHNVGGNRDRGTLVGGLLGAALGSAIAANTPGREIALPRGTVVRVRLARAVAVRAR